MAGESDTNSIQRVPGAMPRDRILRDKKASESREDGEKFASSTTVLYSKRAMRF